MRLSAPGMQSFDVQLTQFTITRRVSYPALEGGMRELTLVFTRR